MQELWAEKYFHIFYPYGFDTSIPLHRYKIQLPPSSHKRIPIYKKKKFLKRHWNTVTQGWPWENAVTTKCLLGAWGSVVLTPLRY